MISSNLEKEAKRKELPKEGSILVGNRDVFHLSGIQADVNGSGDEVDIILDREGRKVKSPEWVRGGSGSPLRSEMFPFILISSNINLVVQ